MHARLAITALCYRCLQISTPSTWHITTLSQMHMTKSTSLASLPAAVFALREKLLPEAVVALLCLLLQLEVADLKQQFLQGRNWRGSTGSVLHDDTTASIGQAVFICTVGDSGRGASGHAEGT